MDGYQEFRNKIKKYKNKEIIGTTIAELTNIKPITIKVMYGLKEFEYTKFNSVINLDNLKSEDIGTKYVVQISDNNVPWIVGKANGYEDYYTNN